MAAEISSAAEAASRSDSRNYSFSSNVVFIYELPWIEKKRLSDFLDQDGRWVGLALRQMNYSAEHVEDIRRCCSRSGCSPSEQLLMKWGNLNHTIVELFVVLSRECYYSAMEIIKRFVEEKYHILIKNDTTADSHKVMNGPVASSTPDAEYTTDRNAESAQRREEFAQQPTPPEPPVDEPAGPHPANNITPTVGGLQQFTYDDLREATNNWNPLNELGRGGFGIVYKGYFKHTDVAIKKIKGINTESARTELRQSFNELKYLDTCRHVNVVPLLGYSVESNEPCLVYQFMPGGSLDNRLFPKTSNINPLSIEDRVKIAKGTARGLQYLHTFAQKPIIHGDVKPGNILLDDSNEPRIGDFGLTRELAVSDSSMKVSRVYGTRPYIPHEFITHRQLSTKVDSYSYGLVLYEIITGKRVLDEKRPVPIKHLKDFIICASKANLDMRALIDPSLSAEDANTLKSCAVLLKVGFSCTADDPEKRPEMVTVYERLAKELG